MNENAPCPTCGTPLPADAPMGVCPNCLIGAGFGTAAGAATAEKLRAFEPPSLEDLARHFPQLEIVELLGRGGMGAVYKARQRELDRMVALKILPPAIGEEAGFAERFAREAKALARLNHPGIVTIHEFGRADGLYYFVMEFVDGVNLRQLLQGERVSPREALAIVPQICDALQFAHDHGIVHRDIKPENILMDRRGRVKVADFGIAKLTGANEQTGSGAAAATSAFTEAGKVIGTPSYMAPEQASNPADVDHRADIYALGVVFYQMLTGELPGRHVQPPSSKVHIDVRLDEVVMRALAREPERRYQQASVLKTRVEEVASAGSPPEHAVSDHATVAHNSWAERHRGMPKLLWLPVALLGLSILSKFILLPRSGALGLADILFQGLLIAGLCFRFRLAYLAAIVAGVFVLPALARVHWPFALLGIVFTAGIVGPILWSTSWFLPPDMPGGRRRAWIRSTAALAAVAVALGFAIPASAILSHSARRSSANGNHRLVNIKAGVPRSISTAPFTAHYQQGTIELVALAPHPSKGAQAWLPNGAPTDEPFPSDSGSSTAAGKIVKEMAFRIHSARGHPGTPVVRFNPESGVTGMGLSQGGHYSNKIARLCVQDLACPPDAKQVDVQIGIADGVWETVIPIPAGGDKLYGSREETGKDGRWEAGFQGIAGENGEVAISFHFIRREEWETRMVAVMADAKVKPLASSRLNASGGVWRGMTSFSRKDFAQVAEISLQRRKYQWVEFRNVALVPDHRTTLEVSDAASVSQTKVVGANASAAKEHSESPFSEKVKALLKRTFDPPVPLIDERNLWGIELAGGSPIEFTGKVVRVMDYASRLAEDPRNTPHEVHLKLVSGEIPQFPDARRFTFVPKYEPGIASLGRFKPSQEVVFVCSRDGAIRAMKNVPSFEELKKGAQEAAEASGSRPTVADRGGAHGAVGASAGAVELGPKQSQEMQRNP